MGIWIDADVYSYIVGHGGSADVYMVGDDHFFSGDWEDYDLEVSDGGVYTISTRPSQAGVKIGNTQGF